MPRPLAGPRNDVQGAGRGRRGGASMRVWRRARGHAGRVISVGPYRGGGGGDTSSAPAGHLPLKGKATGRRAEAPSLCECLTAGRTALFPAARKNFKKISKCRKRQTAAKGNGLPHQCAHWFAMTRRGQAGSKGRRHLIRPAGIFPSRGGQAGAGIRLRNTVPDLRRPRRYGIV